MGEKSGFDDRAPDFKLFVRKSTAPTEAGRFVSFSDVRVSLRPIVLDTGCIRYLEFLGDNYCSAPQTFARACRTVIYSPDQQRKPDRPNCQPQSNSKPLLNQHYYCSCYFPEGERNEFKSGCAALSFNNKKTIFTNYCHSLPKLPCAATKKQKVIFLCRL